MSKHTIVGDSSPLIALAIIGQLELLPRLYSRVVIPPDVWETVVETVGTLLCIYLLVGELEK